MADQDHLYNMVEGIRTDQREQFAQMRMDIASGLSGIRSEMAVQNGRVRKTEDRLTIIETERKEEGKQALKRGGLMAVAGSAALTGLLELAKSIFGK